jgi:hypothetical protein
VLNTITLSPLSKDHLCQVWFKLAKQFYRRRLKYGKVTDDRCQVIALATILAKIGFKGNLNH